MISEEVDGLMRTENTEVLALTIPTSLALLNLTEEPPHQLQDLWRPNSWDIYLNSYLHRANMETKSERKVIFASNLERIIEMCQHAIIKHLKSLVTLLVEYLKETEDEPVRLACVACFRQLLVQAVPRITAHSLDILMCCVHVIASSHQSGNVKVLSETRELVLVLKNSCNGSLDKHLECLKGFNNKGVQGMVNYVFAKK